MYLNSRYRADTVVNDVPKLGLDVKEIFGEMYLIFTSTSTHQSTKAYQGSNVSSGYFECKVISFTFRQKPGVGGFDYE